MSFLDRVLGKPLASQEEEEQKVGPLTALPMLGLDALSSAAYGPESALTLLLPLGALGLAYIGPITAIILALLAILYFSYRQTTAAYPTGGGSYTVAKENLGQRAGLLAAASLLLDYVLNVSVGIAAGAGALVSAVPVLQPHVLGLCLLILAGVAVVNLRGIREAGAAFVVPTYLFVGCLGLALGIGLVRTALSGGHPHPIETPPALPAATAGATLWLLMKSFSSGCTAMTGVEAISNGVSAFAKPAVQNAQRTLTLVVVILGALLAGIAYLCRVYHIGATDPDGPGYQSVLSQLVAAVAGRGVFYYVTLGSILAVLSLSANTSYADFPRLCRLIAEDDFLPHAFASRGRRLVYTLGIGILTAFSAGLLIAFGGITDRLIPLFAIGAFGAFTLSQAGMTVYWQRNPGETPQEKAKARVARSINALGAVATAVALAVVLATKFRDGAWITVLLIPALMFLFSRVKRHYDHVARETNCPPPDRFDPSRTSGDSHPHEGLDNDHRKGAAVWLGHFARRDRNSYQYGRRRSAAPARVLDGICDGADSLRRADGAASDDSAVAVSPLVSSADRLYPPAQSCLSGPDNCGDDPGTRRIALVSVPAAQPACNRAESGAAAARRSARYGDQCPVVSHGLAFECRKRQQDVALLPGRADCMRCLSCQHRAGAGRGLPPQKINPKFTCCICSGSA